MKKSCNTATNKAMALLLLLIGILTVPIANDATAFIILAILAIPMFFARTNWFYHSDTYSHKKIRRECTTCSKHHTMRCPQSSACYSNPVHPCWSQGVSRSRH
jgi:hypothetical protein